MQIVSGMEEARNKTKHHMGLQGMTQKFVPQLCFRSQARKGKNE